MKKLKLKALELGASELLKREQLRNIFGGSGDDLSGGGSGEKNCPTTCSAWDSKLLMYVSGTCSKSTTTITTQTGAVLTSVVCSCSKGGSC